MSSYTVQVGFINLQGNLNKVSLGATLAKLEEILVAESIRPMLIPTPLVFEDLGLTGDEMAGAHAQTLFPRQFSVYPRLSSPLINRSLPLIVVFPTSITSQERNLQAVLMHEFGHAKRDYPTIWDLLEHTDYFHKIDLKLVTEEFTSDRFAEWNPFSNTNSDDPFIEFTANEFARKYFPNEIKMTENEQIFNLQTGLRNGTFVRGFCLDLYLKIRSELHGTNFPGVEQDESGHSVANAIKDGDFRSYAIRVLRILLTDQRSPFFEMGRFESEIMQQVEGAFDDFSL